MPNIADAFPSKYLKASDLQGREVVVTLDRVEFEGVGQKKEMKAVLYFQGKDKGMVLNKTNANKITEIVGSALTEDWRGHRVRLYPTETSFQGDMVDCIRIKATAPPAMKMTRQPPPPPVQEFEDEHNGPITDSDIPF